MISKKSENLGVIGYPIEHSLSPAMQNAAIAEGGLPYRYAAFPVCPEDLRAAVMGMKALQFRGFNVTIPHKINIIPFMDVVDESVRRIGAINTVVIEEGKLLGYNTDYCGFVADLENHDFAIAGKRAVLLGAGGAARAVLWGLISRRIGSLSIGVRNVEKAKSMISSFVDFGAIDVFHWEDAAFQLRLQEADLLINTTPLGMSPKLEQAPPVEWRLIRQDALVCDLIYNPAETRFLRLAKGNGNRTMNGMGMLVEQGATALELWSKSAVSRRAMREALVFSLK